MKRRYFTIILLIFLTIIFASCKQSKIHSMAADGAIDLSTWNFEQKRVANIDDRWELNFGEFLTPDDFNGKEREAQHINLTGTGAKHMLIDMAAIASLFVIGMEHLVLYILRRKDKYNLYLSCLCLAFAIKSLVIEEEFLLMLFTFIPQEVASKIEYITFYLAIMFFIMLISSFFPGEASPKVCKAVAIAAMGCSLTTIVTTVRVYSHIIAGFWIVTVATCLYIIHLLIKAVRRKREGALLTITGALVFIAAVFNDILYYMEKVQTLNMAPYGLLVFVFSQLFLLSRRYADAFESLEEMSKRLTRIDKVKDDFLTGVSQELLEPLNGIIEIIEPMVEGSGGEVNQEKRQDLSLVLSIAKRLNIYVRHILDLSKLKNEDIELNKKPVSIKPYAQAILDIFSHLVVHKKVMLINKIPEDMPLVEADENRLLQIMYNLVGNALRYKSEGSIVISASKSDRFINISVAHAGTDIPEGKYKDIFKKYNLSDDSYPYGYGETGLEFSITKKLIELHGGSISAELREGEGATVSFTLPIAEDLQPYADADMPKAVTAEKKPVYEIRQSDKVQNTFKILIVDDEPVNIHVLYRYLTNEGYSVVIASNGPEAIRKVYEQKDIDLVILDIAMPGCSGLHVCRVLRKEYSLVELPILLLTARNQNQEIVDAFEAGANDYIIKPFNKTVMLSRVKTQLSLKKAANEIISSEVKFLQAQIKPHFLYNTLNTLTGLIRTDSEKARELLNELSIYLRGKYRFKSMDHFVSVGDELKLVEAYLGIEKIRYGERLKVEYENNANQSFRVPPLILQPIIENAVKHGICSRKEGGTISISVKEKESSIDFIVCDDGVGMDEKKVSDILSGIFKSEGIGIQNVDRRLRNYYGRGLQIESKPGIGTKVTISIPKTKERDGHDKGSIGG